MKLNKISKIIPIILIIPIALFIGYYIRLHLDEFRNIHIENFWSLILLLLLTFLYSLIQGVILNIILLSFNIRLKFKEWFGLTMITLLGNLIIPLGGVGIRAGYLKKFHAFKYTQFIATLSLDVIINFIVFTLGGGLALGLLYLRTSKIDFTLMTLFLLVLGLSILVWLVPIRMIKRFRLSKNRFFRGISDLADYWQTIRRNYELIFKISEWMLMVFIVQSGMFYFAFYAFNFKITFLDSFLPACLSLYALFIRLIPASFGFYEGAIVYSAKVLGFTAPQGLAVVAISRLTTFFWTISLGLLYGYILFQFKFKKTLSR